MIKRGIYGIQVLHSGVKTASQSFNRVVARDGWSIRSKLPAIAPADRYSAGTASIVGSGAGRSRRARRAFSQ